MNARTTGLHRWAGMVLAGVLVLVAGCDGLAERTRRAEPPAGNAAGEPDRASLDAAIDAARQYLDEGYHLDPAPLTDLLTEHVGDWPTTAYICERFYWPTFCWRTASQLNPDLRGPICVRYVEALAEECGECADDAAFVDTACGECRAGLPVFIY